MYSTIHHLIYIFYALLICRDLFFMYMCIFPMFIHTHRRLCLPIGGTPGKRIRLSDTLIVLQDFDCKKLSLVSDKFVHVLKTTNGYLCDCSTAKYCTNHCYHVNLISNNYIQVHANAILHPTQGN